MMTPVEILIVEDESIVAWDVSNRLQQLGYKVSGIAASGREAIAKAVETEPGLVLMDIKLKGEMDGVEAVRQIQAKVDVPAIYLTAYADDATLQRAKVTGPHGYLLKPLEDRELHSTIEMALFRHNLDRQLKESERWLNTTLNSIDDAVIATDAHDLVKFMNPTAEQLTGWSAQEAMGQRVAKIFELIKEEGGHLADNPVAAVLRDSTAINRTGHLLVARNNSKIPIDYNAAPIRDDKHVIIGTVITFQDISQKRAIQARIEKQERLAAIGQLAGGMAHEFNNILTGIIGFAELAGSHLDDPHRVGQDLQYVIEQGQRAAHLVRQMLDFSRKSFIQTQTLAVVEFLQDTISLLKHTIPGNIAVTVAIEPACEGLMMEADPGQIRQALTNLVTNGVEAMPQGGTLSFQLSGPVYRPEKPIHLPNFGLNQQQSQPDQMIALSITDTGVGIRPRDFAHIFEPFFTTKEVGQGAGLGLSQVYGIVKQHGGEIEIDSKAGQGTTCTIYLPVRPLTRKPATEIAAKLPRGNGELLWLIEDDAAIEDATRATLEYLGYQVRVAAGRPKAVEFSEQEEIALILVDVTSPDLGGVALARTLLQSRPTVQIIVLTNYSPDSFEQALPADRVSWLQKPWKLEKLAHTVNEALARAKEKG